VCNTVTVGIKLLWMEYLVLQCIIVKYNVREDNDLDRLTGPIPD